MADTPMLADYVALIIQLFEGLIQFQIEQEGVKRGKSCLQKCQDMNLDLWGLDGRSGSGKMPDLRVWCVLIQILF